MTEAFAINSNDIMHETIDGEVVIVNLDSGAYYAFDGSGEYIWNRLAEGGVGRAQLVTELRSRYPSAEAGIDAAVDQFLRQLLDEQLIVANGAAVTATVTTGGQAAAEFVPPQLNKYTDMEALLLADPIHEVEAGGWPNLK